MKSLILTINDNKNYGNRLQNYAQSIQLGQYGCCKTINHLVDSLGQKPLFSSLKGTTVSCAKKALHPTRAILDGRKFSKFRSFSNAYVPTEGILLTTANGLSISGDWRDAKIVIGSDQVWNYTFGLSSDDVRMRLGSFAPSERLVAYAASIGLDEVDDEWRSIFQEGWSRIPFISVREDRAAELVKEISGRDASVVLDPTLMLKQEQWAEILTDFVPEGDRYVLTYFLGCPSENQEIVISSTAKSLCARIRRINDIRDRETYVAGPAEFVELFSKAQYVFTDSYHACCFSILYNKPFKVFNRAGFDGRTNMNSRMKTLFRLFKLEDLMGEDGVLPTFDWAKINGLLGRHRRESREWLEGALEVNLEALRNA